jgi:MFS family permease
MAATERSFPVLYERDFRLLWIGQIISFSGTWMHSTAQGWLIYSLTRSPFLLGMVAAASSAPVLAFVLLGGVAADRFKKRNLIMLTQALSILPALGIGVLTQAAVIQVWQIMVFGVFLGTVNAFDVPARQSFFAEIVERGSLINAIALNSAAFNGSRIIGPVMEGLAISYIGLPACFYLNAASFLAVIIALYKIKEKGGSPFHSTSPAPRPAAGLAGILVELKEGMRFIRQQPFILAALTLTGGFSLFGIPFVSLLPVFAADIFNSGARGLGFLAGSAGVGALAAALSIAYKSSEAGEGKLAFMRASAVVFPVSLIIFSFSRNFYLACAALALAGFGLVRFLSVANGSIQLKTPDELRGRVMSVYTLVFLGTAPLGNTLMGALGGWIGASRAVAVSSALCALLSLVLGRRLKP